MTEKTPTYLVASCGFAANGVVMRAGDYVTDQFDPQTIKLLKDMKRLVETDVAPGDDAPVIEKKGKNRAVDLPGGLPGGLPGAPEA